MATLTECDADADTKIVSTALELAILDQAHDVVVVADDTDIAIMLLYHWKEELGEIIFYQEKQQKGWSIKEAAERLGNLRDHVLFVHAWSGCDTVSAPYGKGKSSFFNQVKKSEELKDISITIMNDAWAVQEEVGKASRIIFNIMYSGKQSGTLIKLRHKKYMDMVCKGQVDPERLPPSPRAAYFHALRAHLQIITWKLLDDDHLQLKPEEWGWELTENGYAPIASDIVAAPENILKIVRCNCKENCTTNRCSCRKNYLKCASTCGNCQGQDRDNSEEFEEVDHAIDTADEDDEERNIFDMFS